MEQVKFPYCGISVAHCFTLFSDNSEGLNGTEDQTKSQTFVLVHSTHCFQLNDTEITTQLMQFLISESCSKNMSTISRFNKQYSPPVSV